MREIGFALFRAQQGKMHAHAKPLHGFGSAGVLEVVELDRDGTYRAVYTVRLKHGVYVVGSENMIAMYHLLTF